MLNSALAAVAPYGQKWTTDKVNFRTFDTNVDDNNTYGRMIINSNGLMNTYKVQSGNAIDTTGLITRRCFQNYEKSELVTTTTKQGIKFNMFGYLRVCAWGNNGVEPKVELWINSRQLFNSDSHWSNGLFYPLPPYTWADFYVNAGTAQLWFFPCYE